MYICVCIITYIQKHTGYITSLSVCTWWARIFFTPFWERTYDFWFCAWKIIARRTVFAMSGLDH